MNNIFLTKRVYRKNIIHKKNIVNKKNIDKKNMYIKKFKQHVMIKKIWKNDFQKNPGQTFLSRNAI